MCTLADVAMLLPEMNLAPEMTTCYLDNVYFRKAMSDNRWDKERKSIHKDVCEIQMVNDAWSIGPTHMIQLYKIYIKQTYPP